MCEFLYYPPDEGEWKHHHTTQPLTARHTIGWIDDWGRAGSGVIVKNGLIAHQWGRLDERRALPREAILLVLSTLCAVALSEGKIAALDGPLEPSHRGMTWRRLLQSATSTRNGATEIVAAARLVDHLTKLFNRGLSQTVEVKINSQIGSRFDVGDSGDPDRLPQISSSLKDLGRLALLHERRGMWIDHRVFSPLWIDLVTTDAAGLYWKAKDHHEGFGLVRRSEEFSVAVLEDLATVAVAI